MNNWFVYLSVFEDLYDKVISDILSNSKLNKPVGLLYSQSQKRRVHEGNYSQLDIYSSIVKASISHEPDLKFIKEMENEYAVSTLSLTIFADRHLGNKKYSYKQKLALIELTFRYALGLIEKNSIKFAWFESVGGFTSYILYLVFQKSGVKICMLIYGQYPKKLIIASDHRLIWDGVEDEIDALKDTSPPSERELEKAKNFLENYRSVFPKTPIVYSRKSWPTISFLDFKLLYRWAKDYLLDKHSILNVNPIKLILLKILRIFRGYFSRSLFTKVDFDSFEDYVFFPLHYQPEMTTLVCAPFCINQVSVIEDLAKSIPVGMRLVVKEHHGSIGRRPISDYINIKKNWNVILVGPQENTMDLINHSKAILTINSTVGLQGILLGKPVIALARVGYDACSSVTRLHDVPKENYNFAITTAISSNIQDKDILNFCIAVDRVMLDHDESFNLLQPSYEPNTVMDKKNIKVISDLVKNDFLNFMDNNSDPSTQ